MILDKRMSSLRLLMEDGDTFKANLIMIKALILIGGKSTRMGHDKYLIEVDGKPQYQILHEMASSLGLETYISCSKEQIHHIDGKYSTITDEYEAIGPIGGIASAILTDKKTSWLVLSCDLIALKSETIKTLLEANDNNYDIVTYGNESDGFWETTCTIYNPEAFIVIKRKVRDEQYKIQELLRKCTVKALTPPQGDELKNANTPEDLI